LEFALAESNQARLGSRSVLLRLAELVFVEVLRSYLTSTSQTCVGWLAGLRDPVVGRAVGRLHLEPARSWTLSALARDVGTSRSGLAERFASLVGQPPMLYLANWRMQLAATWLAAGEGPVSAVAYDVGYESEAAFCRAFKKLTGLTPGWWRSARRSSALDRRRRLRSARSSVGA
jgi:AraC-like DNA-binding protein